MKLSTFIINALKEHVTALETCALMMGKYNKGTLQQKICLVQVRLGTEVPHTPSSARSGLDLMTSRS